MTLYSNVTYQSLNLNIFPPLCSSCGDPQYESAQNKSNSAYCRQGSEQSHIPFDFTQRDCLLALKRLNLRHPANNEYVGDIFWKDEAKIIHRVTSELTYKNALVRLFRQTQERVIKIYQLAKGSQRLDTIYKGQQKELSMETVEQVGKWLDSVKLNSN